jgi:hypothetical protein
VTTGGDLSETDNKKAMMMMMMGALREGEEHGGGEMGALKLNGGSS